MYTVLSYIGLALLAVGLGAKLLAREDVKRLFFGSGRRFTFVWSALAIATVALFTNLAKFAEWASFVNWLGGAYILANVGEKFAEKINGKPPAPSV